MESILDSVKKILGIDSSYTVFDEDIIMHINTAFSTLNQLGVGPEAGFAIVDDSAVWTDFIPDGSPKFNSVKTYVSLRCRLIFDPPATSFTIAAFEKQLEMLEWRLSVERESTQWVNPDPPTTMIEEEL